MSLAWEDPQTEAPTSGLYNVWVDHWWLTNEKGQIAFYQGYAPQCNQNQWITEKLAKGEPTKQIPRVYRRAVRGRDYE